jgi:hypothetical protein
MPNKWIEHVKEFSKKNNISYACALTHPDLKKEYQPVIKRSYKEKMDEKRNLIQKEEIKIFIKKIKNMSDDDKPLLKMKFNSLNSKIRDDIKNNYAQYYDKLFSK